MHGRERSSGFLTEYVYSVHRSQHSIVPGFSLSHEDSRSLGIKEQVLDPAPSGGLAQGRGCDPRPLEIDRVPLGTSVDSEALKTTRDSLAARLDAGMSGEMLPQAGSAPCGVCLRPIRDRYVMRVANASYHERCLRCFACGGRLAHTCFARDSKLYCRLDYDRLYVKKCLGCAERVAPEELVMRALDSVFHLRCFVCVVCGARLQKGDQFVVKQGQLFCRPDYEKEVEMLQGYAQGTRCDFPCDELVPAARAQDGRRGPKRPRTILTTQQRRAFKASFEVSPKPCRKVREALAKETGLSVRIVQVWFQNQRAKMKKIQKKARQEKGNGKDDDIGDEKCQKTKIKEEEQSPVAAAPFLNDSCSDTEAGGHSAAAEAALRGFVPVKQELLDADERVFYKAFKAEPGEPAPRHDYLAAPGRGSGPDKGDGGFLSFQYSSGPGLEAAHAHLHHHHHMFLHQHQPPALGLNPIDRLYSMQTSYFCGEEAALVDQ
ncbi:LIM homeobox transcription factor 1-alpha-like [Bacillus rossius redtenbacheri]|uniref:LIM homeobox transcription factor 1-alpha-like n=1 Tax=Bacillus rossius redtenbacheri TaxID=93214 RepID=UPI002FDDB68F